MQKRKKIELNEKLFYRFIEFTSKLRGIDLPHEVYKQIVLDNYCPQIKSEKRVKRLANSFKYLYDNTSSDFDSDLILSSYYLLTGRKLSKQSIKLILNKYYKKFDDSAHKKASSMHLFILDMNIAYKVEYAFLITNYILLENGYYPIIVYPSDKNLYDDAIKCRKYNPNQFYIFLIQDEHFIRKSHNHRRLIDGELKSLDEIISVLTSQSEKLKSHFNIKELYLYGSYVKRSETPSSDVDMLVVFKDPIKNYNKFKLIKEIKKYLYGVMGCRIDIMDFDHALSKLEIHEMTHTITII